MKDLVIITKKFTKPSHKKGKRKHTSLQYIDRDVPASTDRNPKDEEYVRQFTKKLHYTSEAHAEVDNGPFNKAKTGIMNTKIQELVKDRPNISSKDVLRLLSFSDVERD